MNDFRVPEGYEPIEAYRRGDEIVVLGQPETDDERHNCDEQGCGSLSHVLGRFRLSALRQTQDTACSPSRALDGLRLGDADESQPMSWPEAVTTGSSAKLVSDDEGRTVMRVVCGPDCDAHLSLWSDQGMLGGIRVCTRAGGGRNVHTRMALLHLLRAMQLDAGEEIESG